MNYETPRCMKYEISYKKIWYMLYKIWYILIVKKLFFYLISRINLTAMDVYDDSPTLVTTWLTIMPKISILIFLLQLLIGIDVYLNLFSIGVSQTIDNYNLSGTTLEQLLNLLFDNLVNISYKLQGVSTPNYIFNGVSELNTPNVIELNINNSLNSVNPSSPSVNILTNLLLLSSLLSLIIGAIVGLSQIRIKRLLAYSTINHVGFLLLALSVFSNSSLPTGAEAFIFYIIQYTITNLNIFLIILALSYIINNSIDISYFNYGLDKSKNKLVSSSPYKASGTAEVRDDVIYKNHEKSLANHTAYANKLENINENKVNISNESYAGSALKIIKINISDIEYINSFKGLFYKNPILSLSFSICLFSFAGVPPLIGFFAKQQVLYSSNSAGYFFLSLIAIIVSVISAFYYLKIIKIIFSINAISTPLNKKNISQPIPSNNYTTGVIEKKNNKQTPLSSFSAYGLEEEDSLVDSYNRRNTSLNFGLEVGGAENLNTRIVYHLLPWFGRGDWSTNILSNAHSFIIGTLTISIMIFILNPELLLNSIAIITSLILNL
uniref:NADH dehydrogenase subunit 2 n=1 Tax=Auricularia villosula TaxID=1579976 RepID=UPI00207AB630|nr:NADH dehydrogenase subunit 2 [Auricularia villosula]URP31164.1 NADH dehydrogenase subunit 2 [Auricularia villosula]